ncbi:MAG: hypothetical protein QQN41_08580 [Nitrosopumilus sp.]
MKKREYYSVRTGKHPSGKKLMLGVTNRLIRDIYLDFRREGFFDEYLGFSCVDQDFVSGKLGEDVEAKVFRALKKDNLYPFEDKFLEYSENDLFDVIEFLSDCVSKPIKGEYHSWANCGMHWEEFDKKEGEKLFYKAINEIIVDYSDGFQINEQGEILITAEEGINEIFKVEIKSNDPVNIDKKIKAAIKKFRYHRSSLDERRSAVRELVDVLEFLTTKAKGILNKKDESDLFNIANNFGIRHHNPQQKTNYDESIWLSWMFYFYLATIYAYIKLIDRSKA